jgi:hypothetical protein
LKDEEIIEALKMNSDDEDLVICNFVQDGYLKQVRKRIATEHTRNEMQGSCYGNIAMTEEQKRAYTILLEKRKKTVQKITHSDTKQRVIKHSKLKLDEALEQLDSGRDPNKVFEGWSEARIKAYAQIHTKPNSYYYRFNAPGEKQGSGAWKKALIC